MVDLKNAMKNQNKELLNVIRMVKGAIQLEEINLKVINYLKENNLIEKIEPYKLAKASCYRCHNAIEPMISKQWFMNMGDLAKQALEVVDNGELEIIPTRVEKIYRL